MKSSIAIVCLMAITFNACFLFKDYKRSSFSYSANGQTVVVPLVVPKGFVREEVRDTAGVNFKTFYYKDGSILYAAYVKDTLVGLQPFDIRMHQPQFHRLGGTVYKGQDEKELFYREIRQGNLRFGYRLVPGYTELLFDSATNFASLQKPLR